MSCDCEYACGCCGGELDDPECDLWCRRCRDHVLSIGLLAEATYFGQFGEPCPFQTETA